MKQWYEELFEDYARKYDQECFTQGTIGEVDFIENEIGANRNTAILDIGCGTGRHAIELARRGYHVTGVDLSESQLARAREKAKEAGVSVEFLAADARKLGFKGEYDLALIICEGGFSLMETDEMNFEILRSAARALKDGGKIIFTALNALFPLSRSVKEFINENAGAEVTSGNTFDVLTFREYSELEVEDDNGKRKKIKCNERYFAPSEIRWYLASLGFTAIHIGGARLGEFSRSHPLTSQDYEMLVVAQRV